MVASPMYKLNVPFRSGRKKLSMACRTLLVFLVLLFPCLDPAPPTLENAIILPLNFRTENAREREPNGLGKFH